MSIVNVARVASALNLSEQRVQQLVHEGMPRESRGQYDAVKCMLWYIRDLQKRSRRDRCPWTGDSWANVRRECGCCGPMPIFARWNARRHAG